MVKQALADVVVRAKLWLTSANSINLARLIPQSFYYFVAYGQVRKMLGKVTKVTTKLPMVFSVPSGNFGNLTAGVMAKRSGLPIQRFVAATNSNDVVPEYLRTGLFTPRPSIATLSNAMDVGNPSNFARLLDLYQYSVAAMQQDIVGTVTSEDETKQTLMELWQKKYLIDPHTAVAYHGLQQYRAQTKQPVYGVVLSTAQAAKFADRVEPIIGTKIKIPSQLAAALNKPVLAQTISVNYTDLQSILVE
ncbi:MAG: threonine synthase [uncultured bacterium]|nr:MAG: threonine synthase [uncultured bacterium]